MGVPCLSRGDTVNTHPICEAILSHLRAEQRPLHRDNMIAELIRLAKAAPDAYPTADVVTWNSALDQLIKDRLISAAGGRVAFIRQQDRKPDVTQRDETGFLF
jgi:hypothetical protein